MDHFTQVAAVLVGVFSVARTARLIAHDTFPPVVHLRIWWDTHITGSWGTLAHCQFCLTPWMAAGMFGWWWLAGGESAHWTWWMINGVWGASYLSAVLVSWDSPDFGVTFEKP